MHHQISDVSDLDPRDDLEVVPLESDDAEMWDANNENEDDLKQSQIKSTLFPGSWPPQLFNFDYLTQNTASSQQRRCPSPKIW